MKIISAMFIIILATPSAFADVPLISPEALGQIDGITAVCSQVDPNSEAKYVAHAATILTNVSETDLAALRSLPQYQKTYQSLITEIGHGNDQQALKACATFLQYGSAQ